MPFTYTALVDSSVFNESNGFYLSHQLCFQKRGRGGELDVLVLFGGFGFVQKRDCLGDPLVGRMEGKICRESRVESCQVEIRDIFTE